MSDDNTQQVRGAVSEILLDDYETDCIMAIITQALATQRTQIEAQIADHVALREQVTRADERQRIADKLAAVPDEVYPVDVFGGPLSTDESREANELLKDAGLPTFDRVGANAMRHAYRVASRLAREQED